ncbi:MAG: helix-turn-helix transcriptional regulator [Betaproteobacteria bacterium]|nr:helix-turn-helix transcriptional regulator [Betaproteobacteria bacterium]
MLSAEFGNVIKRERLGRGLTQAELAAAAKVSRTTLSRLEGGKPLPVQTDVLDRIFQALGVKPQLAVGMELEERRRARLEQRARIDEQRTRHLRLAVRLASGSREARKLIQRARGVVDLWRERRTCSPFYIKRWSGLLALPPAELAQRMASLGEWEDALFQNTPWSWAWS